MLKRRLLNSIVLSLVTAFLLTGCQRGIGNEWTPLIATNARTQFESGSFLGRVSDLYQNGGSLFLCDNRGKTVHEIDFSFRLKNHYGEPGVGPGELQYCTRTVVQNDSLYVYDAGQRQVKVFSLGSGYVRSFKTPHYVYSFAIVDDLVAGSVRYSDYAYGLHDQDSNLIREMGDEIELVESRSEYNEDSHRVIKRHSSGKLIAAAVSYPTIDVVDLEDEDEIVTIDMSTFPILSNSIARAKLVSEQNQSTESSTHAILIKDVSLSSDYAFILYWDTEDNFNKMIRVSLWDNQKPLFYELRDSEGKPLQFPNTIAVNDDGTRVFVHEITSESIYSFSL